MIEEEFVAALVSSKLSNGTIADALGVSRPSVLRWKQGKNTPHPIMMEAVLRYLKKD